MLTEISFKKQRLNKGLLVNNLNFLNLLELIIRQQESAILEVSHSMRRQKQQLFFTSEA